MTPEDEGLRVTFEDRYGAHSELFDRLLVAIGRVPNGGRIGAEAAGVAVDARGFIVFRRATGVHLTR